ncbi:MAG: hypothetical protein NC402_02280 [Prevotella sp.]|nr:hypothetical protein [Prevotella sp.]MCM1074627.1 hypothetical protein [Ruminococcus sp.]
MSFSRQLEENRTKVLLKWGLLLFILIIRGVDISQRHELHPDEVYSVLLAECNDAYYKSVPDADYSGSELRRTLTANHSLGADLTQLYKDNADSPHASLYYMALRISLEGLDEWSPEQVARRGGALNLLFLICTYLLLWQLIERLYGRERSVLLCMACCAMAFLNPGAGECAMLVREYQLAALAVVWYSSALLPLTKFQANWKAYASLIGASALALSTGYLNSFYMITSTLFIAIYICNTINCKQALKFSLQVAVCCLAGLALAWAMYSGWFYFLLRKNAHTSHAFANPSTAFEYGLWRDIVKTGLTLPAAITLGLILGIFRVRHYKIKRQRSECVGTDGLTHAFPYSAALLAACVLTVMSVQYASVLHASRYSFPFMPLLCMAIPMSLHWVGSAKIRKLVYVGITGYFCVYGCIQSPCRNYGWSKQTEILRQGALMHKLNPNEQVILYPILTDTAVYTITHAEELSDTIVRVTFVHKLPENTPDSISIKRFNGPVRALVPTR